MSRRPEDQSLHHLSATIPKWITEVQDSLMNDSTTLILASQLFLDPSIGPTHCTNLDGLLCYKGRLYIGSNKDYK